MNGRKVVEHCFGIMVVLAVFAANVTGTLADEAGREAARRQHAGSAPVARQGSFLTLLGQLGGECNTVHVEGDSAYVGAGRHLLIFDLSEPTTPVVAGRLLLPTDVHDVISSGGLAFVTTRFKALYVVDVGNPASPAIRGTYPLRHGNPDVSISGSTVCVSDGNVDAPVITSVHVLDVSDPTSPVTQSLFGTIVRDVFTTGGKAYTAGDPGLEIYDLGDPSSPALLGSWTAPQDTQSVFVSGSHAYLCGGGLQIVDVSDPTSPVLLGSCPTPAKVVEVVGHSAFVATDYYAADLVVLDVSDPTSPTFLSTLDTPSWIRDLHVASDRVFIACGGHQPALSILDVAAPASPTLLGEFSMPPASNSVAVAGGRVWLAGYDGLKSVDVSDPRYPFVRTSYPGPGGIDLCLRGNLAFLPGLTIVDVSDPASPTIVGGAQSGEYPRSVFVAGDRACVAAAHEEGALFPGGLWIYDVQDPTSPALLGIHDMDREPYEVWVEDDLAYIAAGELLIVDIGQPQTPVLRGRHDAGGNAIAVHVSGDHAYVAAQSELLIFDVSDPATPWLRSSVPCECRKVFVTQGRVYAGSKALHVFDVLNPYRPWLRASHEIAGTVSDIVVVDDQVYVAAWESGLWIFRYEEAITGVRTDWREFP